MTPKNGCNIIVFKPFSKIYNEFKTMGHEPRASHNNPHMEECMSTFKIVRRRWFRCTNCNREFSWTPLGDIETFCSMECQEMSYEQDIPTAPEPLDIELDHMLETMNRQYLGEI